MLRLTQEQHDIINNYYEAAHTTGFSYRGIRNVLRQLRELDVDVQCKLNQNYAALKTELDRIQFNHLIDNNLQITTITYNGSGWYELIYNNSSRTRKVHGLSFLTEILQLSNTHVSELPTVKGEFTDTNHYTQYTTGQYNKQQPISTTNRQPTELDGDVPASDNGQGGTSEMVHPISDKRSRDSQRTESTTESDAFSRSIQSMEDPGVATRRELAEIKRRAEENHRRIDESIRGIVTSTVGFVAAVAGQGNAIEHSSENNDTPKRIEPETVDIDDVVLDDIDDEDITDEDFDDEDVRQSDEADARGAYADDEPEYSDELLDSLPF